MQNKQKLLFVDSLVQVRRKTAAERLVRAESPARKFWITQRLSFPTLAIVILISVSFAAGAYLTWSADDSSRENQPAVSEQVLSSVPSEPAVAGAVSLGPVAKVPNEILFNLTLEQLEIYLAEALKTPEMKEAEVLADRKFKLKIYLDGKKSPFLDIADTLAELKHWKLVLAISNSESSLGKNCYNNNCSGIGVEPGHPYWRNYKNKAEWAKDLDRLIEQRYKNWTLEQMNGVYNQPGSRNWIFAAKQILEDLQEKGIE